MVAQLLTYLFGAMVLAFALVAFFQATFFTVQQRTAAIVQRLGKFVREAAPGFQVKIPFIDRVVGRVNLRVQQLDVEIETKTEDNVFVRMVVAVQYYVLPEKVYDAFYKLDDASRQITSFVFDVVRAQVPKIRLDDVFERKDDIANIVKSELAQEGVGNRHRPRPQGEGVDERNQCRPENEGSRHRERRSRSDTEGQVRRR
jgi:regulator of protease activity HflC (stomatin/prohibitin superfamily)